MFTIDVVLLAPITQSVVLRLSTADFVPIPLWTCVVFKVLVIWKNKTVMKHMLLLKFLKRLCQQTKSHKCRIYNHQSWHDKGGNADKVKGKLQRFYTLAFIYHWHGSDAPNSICVLFKAFRLSCFQIWWLGSRHVISFSICWVRRLHILKWRTFWCGFPMFAAALANATLLGIFLHHCSKNSTCQWQYIAPAVLEQQQWFPGIGVLYVWN